MKKSKFALIVIFLFLFTLPALAQGKNIVRVKVPAVGETFTVELATGVEYVVDPFETVDSPETDIVSGSCITNYTEPTDEIGFNSHFRTSSDGSSCSLELRVTYRGSGKHVMTFLKVRDKIVLRLSGSWLRRKIPKGSYAISQIDPHVIAELNLDRSTPGCREAHDGDKHEQYRAYGIEHVGYFYTNGVREEVDILENRGSWYRVLPKTCFLWYRGRDGDTGGLWLLKLSSKAIFPK